MKNLQPFMIIIFFIFCFVVFNKQSSAQQSNKLNLTTQNNISESTMFKGLRTVKYHVDNIEEAKKWYSKVLGFEPYFAETYYVGFNVGGYELGLDPDTTGLMKGNNLVAYWGVENIESALKHLLELGAKENDDIQDVGGGIKLATVVDPFGNIFGIIENPHFKVK